MLRGDEEENCVGSSSGARRSGLDHGEIIGVAAGMTWGSYTRPQALEVYIPQSMQLKYTYVDRRWGRHERC